MYERYKLVLWQLLQFICEKIHPLHTYKQYSYYLTGLLFLRSFRSFFNAKRVGFWGSTPDPDGGAYSTPPHPLPGWEGCPLPPPPRGGASNCAPPFQIPGSAPEDVAPFLAAANVCACFRSASVFCASSWFTLVPKACKFAPPPPPPPTNTA